MALLIAVLMAISAATKPILLFASTWAMDEDIFFILIFGFGLITFLEIRSQYIFNLERPWEGAPTNSALIKAFVQIKAWLLARP